MDYLILRILYFWGLVMLLSAPAAGQLTGVYTLRLKDKKGSPYSLEHPEAFLSARALARRAKENIPVTYADLPVSPAYLDTLKSLGLEPYCTSRWFNTVTAFIGEERLFDSLANLSFIEGVTLVKPAVTRKSTRSKWRDTFSSAETGGYMTQLTMLHGQELHDLGLRGRGVLIAVLDAGFYHVDRLPAFDSLRAAGRILGTRDIVDRNSDVYDDHTHGMNVLSILAGILPGELQGAAPDASYWLIRTEDVYSEYPVEEDYWTAGAELADSVGADIISSSLGYFRFDDSRFDHTYADMNGHTTVAARAAVMAARRGIIVVNSAGNEGNTSWHYIITPADADSILAAGAVDISLTPTSFTSSGPSSDGRIKPDVAALGRDVFIQSPYGTVITGSGTSFSAPLISGMTACLRQAFPEVPSREIRQTIRECSSQADHPDNLAGYGIPDMMKAYRTLRLLKTIGEQKEPLPFPNPCTGPLFIALRLKSEGKVTLSVYSTTGMRLIQSESTGTPGINLFRTDLSHLADGIYILQIRYEGEKTALPVIKIH